MRPDATRRALDPATVPGLPARAAALRLLDGVLRHGQPIDAVAAQALRDLVGPDRALALAIAGDVLRWLTDLDAAIDRVTAQPLGHDLKARMVLRIALAQAWVLATPPHAAIATALPLVEGGPRRLVHGVFGTLMREGRRLPATPTLRAAVAARWGADWGYGMLTEAAHALAAPPPLDIALRDPADDGGIGGEAMMPGHRRLPRGTAIESSPGFAEGKWWVQNLSAQLPATLLGKGEGRTVLDLCAAPGGKTLQLAAAGWQVTALDNNARRIARLRENLARVALPAEVVEADIFDWVPPENVDAIMLDAPCTATGIFARHPDVLYRIGPKDIAALGARQAAMLDRALGWLKPGGRLVYATCSLERAEGEAIVAPYRDRIEPITMPLPGGLAPALEGWLRVLPTIGRDGFFMAVLRG